MAIEYRTLDYANTDEVRRNLARFYAIPAELDDSYYVPRSADFIEASIATVREQENATNTFAGIAVASSRIIGLHLLRRFDEAAPVSSQPR